MKSRTRGTITIVLVIIAVSFVLLGVFRNEVSIVLKKAQAVCFSCIGLS
ncbi:MAG: hypothetical protein IIU49_00010 [Spirochaetales bacterium]|nr:hypothetical protein [Spirochaetales bacterium]